MVVIIFILMFSSLHGSSNGSLDITFNPVGLFPGDPGVESIWPPTDYSPTATFGFATSVIIDANGKIVAAGGGDSDTRQSMILIRLNNDGSLDTTLNPIGAFPGVPGTETIWTDSFQGLGDTALGIGLLSDGRIVLCGQARGTPAGSTGSSNCFALALLNGANGALDTSFNPVGAFPGVPGVEDIWTASHGTGGSNARALGVAIQANDRIVAVGSAVTTEAGGGSIVQSMSIARLLTNGSLDSSFNAGHALPGVPGIATIPIADFGAGITSAQANAVIIQPDQKILVAGFVSNDNTGQSFMTVVRFTSAGVLDTTFNGNGIFVLPDTVFGANFSTRAQALALQSDGKIVLAGSADLAPTTAVVVRLTAGGTLDPSFNGNGGFAVPSAAYNVGPVTQAFGSGVQVQLDGAIVVGGSVIFNNGDTINTAIVRLITSGTLDTTFVPSMGETGSPGVVVIPNSTFTASTFNEANALVLDSQQRIILAGDADPNGADVFAFIRLASEQAPSPTGNKSCIAQAIIAKYCS